MIEYILVLLIVLIALWYVGRALWKEARGSGCAGCNCNSKSQAIQKTIQIRGDNSRKSD